MASSLSFFSISLLLLLSFIQTFNTLPPSPRLLPPSHHAPSMRPSKLWRCIRVRAEGACPMFEQVLHRSLPILFQFILGKNLSIWRQRRQRRGCSSGSSGSSIVGRRRRRHATRPLPVPGLERDRPPPFLHWHRRSLLPPTSGAQFPDPTFRSLDRKLFIFTRQAANVCKIRGSGT